MILEFWMVLPKLGEITLAELLCVTMIVVLARGYVLGPVPAHLVSDLARVPVLVPVPMHIGVPPA